MIVRQTILLFVACAIVGCSYGPNTTRQQEVILKNIPNLGSLQTRNHIIRLETGSKFSILDLSGLPIASSLTKAEFQEKFPQLYKDFETAIAKIEAGDIILDASMNTPHILIDR